MFMHEFNRKLLSINTCKIYYILVIETMSKIILYARAGKFGPCGLIRYYINSVFTIFCILISLAEFMLYDLFNESLADSVIGRKTVILSKSPIK